MRGFVSVKIGVSTTVLILGIIIETMGGSCRQSFGRFIRADHPLDAIVGRNMGMSWDNHMMGYYVYIYNII